MMHRVLTALLLCSCLALAAEWRPWAGEPERVADEMREMEERAELELFGDLEPDERAEADAYWRTHLHRAPMDALERAQHTVAELQLRQKDYPAALAALTKLHARARSEALRDVTLFNMAEVYRRCLHDNTKAIEHYAKVAGPWRHRARGTALSVLEQTGQADQAAPLVERFLAQSKEKGEKLALLQRLGRIYRDAGKNAEAIAVFERITREFTPKDLEAMRRDVVAEVHRAAEPIDRLMREDRGEEIERIEYGLHERARQLRYAQRLDEFRVFQREIEKVFRRLDEMRELRERLEDDDERDEDDDRERERDEKPRDGDF